MAFCTNCGAQLGDGATFCGNCGTAIAAPAPVAAQPTTVAQPMAPQPKPTVDVLAYLRKIWAAIKGHFVGLTVDYDSAVFKWAMILMLSIGVGRPVYSLVADYLPLEGIWLDICSLGICVLVGIIAAVCILRAKPPQTVKKSNILRGLWIAAMAATLLAFIAEDMSDYVVQSVIAWNVIRLVTTVATALLLLHNKPKSPIAAMVSAAAFALNYCSSYVGLLLRIKLDVSMYELSVSLAEVGWDSVGFIDTLGLFDLNGLGMIILSVATALIVFLIPRKVARYLVYLPTALAAATGIILRLDAIESFQPIILAGYITDWVVIILVQVLLAKACLRRTDYPYAVENGAVNGKTIAKAVAIPLGVVAVLTTAYMLTSALIGRAQINEIANKWDVAVREGIQSESEWDELDSDCWKATATTKWAQSMTPQYATIEKINSNRYTMSKIMECYRHYQANTVTEEVAEQYTYISVEESWENDVMLSYYYDRYMEMKPTKAKVSADVDISINGGTIEVTVRNDNVMPLESCTVTSTFTIMYIEDGYFSNDIAYGRGTKLLTVEEIPGGGKKTESFTFDADDYYDGYRSYIVATLYQASESVTSVE